MAYFIIELILYIKPFLDNKLSIFEEYGAFNYHIDNFNETASSVL